MATGYCTLEDVRRALRSAKLPGDISQEKQIAVDAIVAETEPLEKSLSRHWYAPTGAGILDEADLIDIPTGPKTRDDEHDIQTHGAAVHGADEHDHRRRHANSDALLEAGPRYERRRRHQDVPMRRIRIATGPEDALEPPIDETVPAYTRIRLERRDVGAVNVLSVVNADGGYDDWVASSDYDGGVGNQHRGEDYWVRVNNGGWSELYLDVHAMDDYLATLSNAVYVDIDYGHEGIPRNVRRAVALRAGAELVEEAVIEIPQNATVYNIETKAEEMRSKADDLLEVYRGAQ
ncbi:MAG: hypothetical protein RI568_13670 [Natronomonas sp.]|uniref:hypothetical protein n=1 Tax=Natronomonas sp. TaxID=2184060 RepID=UPI00286FC721|nr:hypothetical protein [Natronomonas sp.]MDR9431731.1 hypothetical protein [Natronomonas sp.]